MAKNITLMGASYTDVPAVVLPQTGGGTARFDDASVTTATASDVASGKVFLASDGTITTGTSSGGGGASSWTKVCEKSYQINATNTSSQTVEMWATGHSEIWTYAKWVYVRVRDTAGKRNGYFYGTDTFFANLECVNDSYTQPCTNGIITEIWNYNNGEYGYRYGYVITGYGVYVDSFYKDGRIRVRQRYNSTYSLTINSTYKIEVYLLDPAGGVPIFE